MALEKKPRSEMKPRHMRSGEPLMNRYISIGRQPGQQFGSECAGRGEEAVG